jgi:hypothetical protein
LKAAEKYRGPGTILAMQDTVGLAVEHQSGLLIIYHHFADAPFMHFARLADKINDLTKVKSIVSNLPSKDIYGFDSYKRGEASKFVDGGSAKDCYKRSARAGGRLNGLAWSMKPYEPDISWAKSLVGLVNAAVEKSNTATKDNSTQSEPQVSNALGQKLSGSADRQPISLKESSTSTVAMDEGAIIEPSGVLITPVFTVQEDTLPPPPESPLEETEREQLTKSRIGQGLYKKRLEEIETCCRLTALSDVSHLRASHIKPWRVCDDEEKLDGNNGLLLSPHIDHLFDQGFISFSDDGRLLVSDLLSQSVLAAWGIKEDANVGQFTSRQRFYLAYHREHIFKK